MFDCITVNEKKKTAVPMLFSMIILKYNVNVNSVHIT